MAKKDTGARTQDPSAKQGAEDAQPDVPPAPIEGAGDSQDQADQGAGQQDEGAGDAATDVPGELMELPPREDPPKHQTMSEVARGLAVKAFSDGDYPAHAALHSIELALAAAGYAAQHAESKLSGDALQFAKALGAVL